MTFFIIKCYRESAPDHHFITDTKRFLTIKIKRSDEYRRRKRDAEPIEGQIISLFQDIKAEILGEYEGREPYQGRQFHIKLHLKHARPQANTRREGFIAALNVAGRTSDLV